MVPRNAITLVGLFAVLALVVTQASRGSWWVEALGPNLATEFVGILVTVLIIERALAQYRESRSKSLATIAARKLLKSLGRIERLIANMLHASWQVSPLRASVLPSSMGALLSPDNSRLLCRLDLGQEANVVPLVTWVDHAAAVLTAERARLRELTDGYLEHLPVKLVEAVEAVEEDQFFSFLSRYRQHYPVSAKWDERPFALGEEWNGYIQDALRVLLGATELAVRLTGEERPGLPPDFWEGPGRAAIGRHRASLADGWTIGVKPARR